MCLFKMGEQNGLQGYQDVCQDQVERFFLFDYGNIKRKCDLKGNKIFIIDLMLYIVMFNFYFKLCLYFFLGYVILKFFMVFFGVIYILEVLVELRR